MRVRPLRDADYPAFVEIRNRAYGDRWLTVEGAHQLVVRAATGGLTVRRFVAEDATGHVVGIGQLFGGGPEGRYRIELAVDPALWRRGIGNALWRTLLAELRALDASIVRTQTNAMRRETLAFLAHRGFVETQRVLGSALDLTTFDPAPFARLEPDLIAQGITFTTLAHELSHDEAILSKVHALHNRCQADQPGETGISVPFETWLTDDVEAPTALPDASFLARTGDQYVGLSVLDRRNGGEPGALHQGFTGVLPAYRGRGIAKALKLRAITYAREHGYREIRTDNSSLNAPMLRVNEVLGFQRHAATIILERYLVEGHPAR